MGPIMLELSEDEGQERQGIGIAEHNRGCQKGWIMGDGEDYESSGVS